MHSVIWVNYRINHPYCQLVVIRLFAKKTDSEKNNLLSELIQDQSKLSPELKVILAKYRTGVTVPRAPFVPYF